MKLPKITNKADQQKGRFGGENSRNGRYLDAVVKPDKDDEDWFEIKLRVFPEPKSPPIQGTVTFYLHQSFRNDERQVRARDGEARLTVYAYGAFTVGAVLDDEETVLELDLAELETAPIEFRER
jgi:hypothetical protein